MQNAIDQLKMLVAILPSRIQQIPEEELAFQPSPGKWSKKQILGHLIDSAMNNHQRFVRLQYEDTPTICYDPDQWNRLNHYQELDSAHILHLWQLMNTQIIQVLQTVSEENRTRLCYTGTSEPVTFGFLIEDYVAHMNHHFNQILSD